MTRALRITSIVVAVAAVLLVALPPVFTSGADEQTQKFLDSPSVLETIKKTKAVANTDTESPLVKQAKAFANYLNPPPKPKRTSPTPKRKAPARPQASISSKFDLLGTSYYALRPQMSLALINEPGDGLRWVRQSSKIGHLVVEEVKDGKVIIRDGTRTYEIEPKRTTRRSLVKGESVSTVQPISTPPSVTPTTPTRPQRSSPRIDARRRRRTATSPVAPKPEPELTPAELALMDQFVKETESIEDPNEWLKRADELMGRLSRAAEVTDEEAALLDELGQELKDANDDSGSN
jgi:hypothetical protein